MLEFDVTEFAKQWADAWNSRDLAAILIHFDDDAVFTSPLAAKLDPGTGGIVRGKAALAAYWQAALQQIPNLHFTVTSIYAGVDSVVIAFRNERGLNRAEILRFRGGKVVEGHGTYQPHDL